MTSTLTNPGISDAASELQTHGPLVMNVALGFVVLSPVLTLIVALSAAFLRG